MRGSFLSPIWIFTRLYRYGFQGQEQDDEVKGKGNSVNYKYRMHDPRIGRFFAVDPLAGKYPWYTPYSFSGNKVIAYTELEGQEEKIAFIQVQAMKGTLTLPTSSDIEFTEAGVTYDFINDDGTVAYTKNDLGEGRVLAFTLTDTDGNKFRYSARFAGENGEGRFLGYHDSDYEFGIGPDGRNHIETIVIDPSKEGSTSKATMAAGALLKKAWPIAVAAIAWQAINLYDGSEGIQLDIRLELDMPPIGTFNDLVEIVIKPALLPQTIQGLPDIPIPPTTPFDIIPEDMGWFNSASSPPVMDGEVGDVVPTPDTDSELFKRGNKGERVNKENGDIWSKSNTTHRGEKWKVWPKGTKGRGKTPGRRNVGEGGEIKPGN